MGESLNMGVCGSQHYGEELVDAATAFTEKWQDLAQANTQLTHEEINRDLRRMKDIVSVLQKKQPGWEEAEANLDEALLVLYQRKTTDKEKTPSAVLQMLDETATVHKIMWKPDEAKLQKCSSDPGAYPNALPCATETLKQSL